MPAPEVHSTNRKVGYIFVARFLSAPFVGIIAFLAAGVLGLHLVSTRVAEPFCERTGVTVTRFQLWGGSVRNEGAFRCHYINGDVVSLEEVAGRGASITVLGLLLLAMIAAGILGTIAITITWPKEVQS